MLSEAALFSFTFMLLGFMSSMMSVYRETFSWTHMLCGMAMSYCWYGELDFKDISVMV